MISKDAFKDMFIDWLFYSHLFIGYSLLFALIGISYGFQ